MATNKRHSLKHVKIRKARMGDVEPIYALIATHAKRGVMLARSRSQLYEALRDFVVAEVKGRVVGCGALTIEWDNLAEIKSVAVASPYQRRGIGRRLVRACISEARRLGIGKVFALTMRPAFFKNLGFEKVHRDTLPHKVWSDCINCTKFPHCDEVAVAMNLPKRKGT
jgi:amino-acid N-acetyltransferase